MVKRDSGYRTDIRTSTTPKRSDTNAGPVSEADLAVDALLRDLDIDLRIVEDGRAAVEAYEDFRPDLVLTDISMPRMDGMELLRRIKVLEPEAHVVMVTAHGTVERAVEAMREVVYEGLSSK